MMRIYSLVLLALLLPASVRAQCAPPEAVIPLFGNNMRGMVTSGGDTFWDDQFFRVNDPRQPSTIGTEGLWIGGKDSEGNLRIAAQTLERYSGLSGFHTGPLPQGSSTSDSSFCIQWDRLWSVKGYQVAAHISDFEADGDIDNPIDALLDWPAKGNPHFAERFGFELPHDEQGLAPFTDLNGNGLYEPLSGEYPSIEAAAVIPSQIIWSVFNDAQSTNPWLDSLRLQVEVQRTLWTLGCDDPVLKHTIFVDYKVINRSNQAYDSVHLALPTYFSMGCGLDVCMGAAPQQDAFFAYNEANTEALSCYNSNISGFGENPPAQATVLLSHPLASFVYYYPGHQPWMQLPSENRHFFNYMTGRWRDGTPITEGGTGYMTGGAATPFAFPGNPNNTAEWSMYNSVTPFSQSPWMAVGSISLGQLVPGAPVHLNTARLYVREPGLNHLENVTVMYEQLDELREGYANGFGIACNQQTCDTDCVWPGDTNTDGIVDHRDLLALAGWQSNTGPERSGLYWGAHTATPWSGTQATGRNLKHADSNGDGLIDLSDVEIIGLNKYLTQVNYSPTAALYPEGPEVTIVGLGNTSTDTLFDTPLANNLRIDVQELQDLMAFAFTLEFDTGYFEDFIDLTFDGELNGTTFNADRAYFFSPRISEGAIDVAFARREGTAPFSTQELFLAFDLAPYAQLPGNQVTFRLKNLIGIRSDGAPFLLGANSRTFYVPEIPVTATEHGETPLHLFPNPTTGQLHVQFPGQQVEQLEVWNGTGQAVRRAQGPFPEQHTLDLSGLPAGLYTLRARMERGIRVEKVVVQP
ncbi:MAG: T9SS type A sorting domain-containing protein [Phaeodactylibacter sp.]|uniref:T9SS type A sorting domain-containing protein n=1 Tax=Phaeodactylibacter sp. TaxID=1940289 RepID=UPI0032EAD695